MGNCDLEPQGAGVHVRRGIGPSAAAAIVDGSHVAQAKPAPDLLLYAAEQLDLPTSRCWYVGDATWDMRAARAASMVGVGIATGAVTMDALRAAGARLAFPTMRELHLELAARDVVPPPA